MQKALLVNKNISVKAAMKQMNLAGRKVLFVVDETGILLGALTDGDIRRWILKKGELSAEIDKVYNREPICVQRSCKVDDVRQLMLDNKIEWIPAISTSGKLVDIFFWEDIFGGKDLIPKKQLNLPVLIMAGGKGTRLDPFTRILPKPLIPIGEKAIIDVIMEKFSCYNINEFYISINHKAKMIKSYFEEVNTKHKIHYLEENEPLGTAGSLKFLRGKIKDSIIVSNCDIIIDCNYNEIVDLHNKNNYQITIVGSFKHFTVPYGICEIEKEGALISITEKPEYDFLVNTGMSIVRKDAIELIEDGQVHITDLIKAVRAKGGKVGVFPVNERSWIDIGQLEEYRKSLSLLGIKQ